MKRWTRIAVPGALVALTLPSAALARPDGITGYSGQQGKTCVSCHGSGDAVPTVALEGPATVQPGQTQQYTLVIRGGPASAGAIDVSVDDPSAMLQAGAGSKLSGSELVHAAPKAFASGEVRFPFTVVAPPAAGVMTVYAVGMSTNGNGGTSGDGVGSTQLQVQVAARGTDGGTTPPPTDGGTTPPPPSGGGTTTPPPPTGGQPGTVDELQPQTGCTAATGAPALAAIAALAAAVLSRRRKH